MVKREVILNKKKRIPKKKDGVRRGLSIHIKFIWDVEGRSNGNDDFYGG